LLANVLTLNCLTLAAATGRLGRMRQRTLCTVADGPRFPPAGRSPAALREGTAVMTGEVMAWHFSALRSAVRVPDRVLDLACSTRR